MQDSIIIFKFLSKNIPDNDQIIYLYATGGLKTQQTALTAAQNITIPIFCPPLNENYVKEITKSFLDIKKQQHRKGLIKIKPIF